MAFCKDKLTVVPEGTDVAEAIVFPGVGVPEQGIAAEIFTV